MSREEELFQKLAEPFEDDEHEWLPQKVFDDGTAFVAAYIRDQPAMARLDEVFGPQNWQLKYQSIAQAHQHAFIASIMIRTPGSKDEWLVREGVGVNEDVKAVEMSLKGGSTDSFKRAAMAWGMGRYLRNLPRPIRAQYDASKKSIVAVPLISKLLKGEYVWVNPHTMEPVDAPRKQAPKPPPPPAASNSQGGQRATVYEDFIVPFGGASVKGKRLSEVSNIKDLKWLMDTFRKSIEDPSKAAFHERNRKQVEAIEQRLTELGHDGD